MSPEQIRGERLDPRTDLFSFGVVLYEMATGKLPFEGENQGSVFDSILNRAPISPVQLNAGVPAELERIISKCLERDRGVALPACFGDSNRPRTAEAGYGLGDTAIRVRGRAPTGVSKRWRAALFATIAIVAGVGRSRLLLLASGAQTHRQRHDCSRRFQQ